MASWEFVVFTGSVDNAGTDSTVEMALGDSQTTTDLFELNSGHNDFERGSCYMYAANLGDLTGDPTRLVVKTSKGAASKEWYLERVEVTDLQSGDVYETSGTPGWLDAEEKSFSLKKISSASGGRQNTDNGFRVEVTTAQDENAGTNADVYVKIYDANNRSYQATEITTPGVTNDFSPGETDSVIMNSIPLTLPIKRVLLFVVDKGGTAIDPEWKPTSLYVLPISIKDTKYYFPINEWFGETHLWLYRNEGGQES